jgi:putative oxidoreductase
MKKLFSSTYKDGSINTALLLIRIGIGALMLVHGLPKMANLFSEGPVQFASVFGLSAEISLGMAVFAEVLCSIFLIVGFGTRLATIPLIVTMLVAVFYIHAVDSFNKQELGIHYLLAYVLLLITGAGKYSLDHLLQRKSVLHGPAEVKN